MKEITLEDILPSWEDTYDLYGGKNPLTPMECIYHLEALMGDLEEDLMAKHPMGWIPDPKGYFALTLAFNALELVVSLLPEEDVDKK